MSLNFHSFVKAATDQITLCMSARLHLHVAQTLLCCQAVSTLENIIFTSYLVVLEKAGASGVLKKSKSENVTLMEN